MLVDAWPPGWLETVRFRCEASRFDVDPDLTELLATARTFAASQGASS
jgi:hypothetical protein